jgi:hypothetical protein
VAGECSELGYVESTASLSVIDSGRRPLTQMSESTVIANQKTIVQNQKTIIGNQAGLRANQTTIKKNQAAILKNQSAILKNQGALQTIIKNQKEILARLKK